MPLRREFSLNDTLYKIKEVWTEYAWQYKNNDMEEQKLDYINFLISFNQDYVDKIGCVGGIGYTNEKMRFQMTPKELQKDTIQLFFLVERDTIPVFFIKKK